MLSFFNNTHNMISLIAIALLFNIILVNRMSRTIQAIQQKLNNLNVEHKKAQHKIISILETDGEGYDETKLYVGNIDYSASEEELAEHFSKFGEIALVNIPTDRYSGRARGFGFVSFKIADDAIKAIELDGSNFKGRQIQVNFARERVAS